MYDNIPCRNDINLNLPSLPINVQIFIFCIRWRIVHITRRVNYHINMRAVNLVKESRIQEISFYATGSSQGRLVIGALCILNSPQKEIHLNTLCHTSHSANQSDVFEGKWHKPHCDPGSTESNLEEVFWQEPLLIPVERLQIHGTAY